MSTINDLVTCEELAAFETDGKIADFINSRHRAVMRELFEERGRLRNQLARICQEGFGNEDTIGQEPADEYVLRRLTSMRAVLANTSTHLTAFLGFRADGLPLDALRDLSELVKEIQPLIKP